MLDHSRQDVLAKAITDRSATVGVVGLGYVGLPLVRAFIAAGFETLGFDLDQRKIEQLLAGKSYIKHLASDWIQSGLERKAFTPTAEMERLGEADAILICVPTPLTASRDPDLSFVESTAEQIVGVLRPGQLVILESTTYPGTTRDIVLPILERSRLEAGSDFFLAYSPEREDPGNTDHSASRIPKVVGGIDQSSLQLAVSLYSHAVVETVPVSSCEVAEACKILETGANWSAASQSSVSRKGSPSTTILTRQPRSKIHGRIRTELYRDGWVLRFTRSFAVVATFQFKTVVSALVISAACLPLAAQEPAEDAQSIKPRKPTKFIRIQHDEFKEPVALQTATAKYVLKDANGDVRLEVFLESAVHIGDAAYYRGFNQRFSHYDAVLYELIASPDQRIPDPAKGEPHPAKLMQQFVGEALGLAHQVDRIDYDAENMVHADLSPEEMKAAQRKRGDDEFVLLADAMLHLLRQASEDASEPETVDPLSFDVLSDPDGGIKLRRMLARTFDPSHKSHSPLQPAQMRSLIEDRNERAMKIFQQQVDQGKKRIAFFWGASHMPDLEKRLILAYGLQPEGVLWRNAWDLRVGSIERAPLDSVLEKTVRSFLDEALDDLFDRPTP